MVAHDEQTNYFRAPDSDWHPCSSARLGIIHDGSGQEVWYVKIGDLFEGGFHTENEENPWWQMDLGSIYEIAEVRLYNRLSRSAAGD
jgi:hypothetical protein